MLKKIMIVGGTVLAFGFVAATAMGADNEPKKANKYQSTAVNGWDDCTAANQLTAGGTPLPACPASDSSGAICNFNDKGSAKFAAKAKDDVTVQVKAGGLDNCEGETLNAVATIQATTNSCTVSSRCTTVTIADFAIPGATCLVASGKCKIKTTVNTAAPGTIVPGENTVIRVGSVALAAGTATVATAGVLVP